jgi:hypothetical protein
MNREKISGTKLFFYLKKINWKKNPYFLTGYTKKNTYSRINRSVR